MGTSKLIGLGEVRSEDEAVIHNKSVNIMNALLAKYDNPEVLADISIDKTASVISVVDAAMKVVKNIGEMRIKTKQLDTESDDRSRLMGILSEIHSNKEKYSGESLVDRVVELDDSAVETVSVVRGELTEGVEQLSTTLIGMEESDDK